MHVAQGISDRIHWLRALIKNNMEELLAKISFVRVDFKSSENVSQTLFYNLSILLFIRKLMIMKYSHFEYDLL